MIEIYEAMSNIPTDAGTALSVGDPLFAYEANLFKDRGLSTLVMVGLFSSSDDTIVDHNLDVVRDIVIFLMQYHNKDHINGKCLPVFFIKADCGFLLSSTKILL